MFVSPYVRRGRPEEGGRFDLVMSRSEVVLEGTAIKLGRAVTVVPPIPVESPMRRKTRMRVLNR